MDREKWLIERQKGIGSSDSPVVVLGEYYGKTARDLALEKLGQLPPDPDSPDIRRGVRQEPVAAQVFEEITGKKVRPLQEIQRHPNKPWMIATLDRIIDGEDSVLEIKCPRALTFRKYRMEGIPEGIQIQGAHQLAVTGRKKVVFGIFCAEVDEMMIVPIERDQALIDLIMNKEEGFWSLIQRGELPGVETEAVKLPAIGGEIIRLDTDKATRTAQALREAQELQAEAKTLYDQAKAQMIALMGDAQAVQVDSIRIYYKEQAGRRSLDQKLLRHEHPEIDWSKYEKVGKPFRVFKTYFNLKEGM